MSKERQFEIRIIRVLWVKKGILKEIETADEYIEIHEEGESNFTADVLAYPELGPNRQGQIGICTTDSSANPQLIHADGTSVQFVPLEAADGKIWWVEMGEWHKIGGTGYFDAPLCRHAGQASLKIGQISVSLKIAPPGFTEDEFEILLDEFRNGLWQLVLDSNSPVTATGSQAGVGANEAFIKAVSEHLRNVRNALEQPHCELKELQEQQLLKRVRPTTKTFQEIATKGSPRYVTGRGHSPSYNTPENQQLATMTNRLLRAMQALHRAAIGVAGDFSKKAEASILRQKQLKETEDYVKIDPDRLQREINELIVQQQVWSESEKVAFADRGGAQNSSLWYFKVTEEVEFKYQQLGFWSNVLAVNEKKKNARVRLVFGGIQSSVLSDTFKKGGEYTLRGHYKLIKEGGSWYVYEISGVVEVTRVDIEQRLTYLKNGQNSLKGSNFKRKATPLEKEEIRRDQSAEREREKRFAIAGDLWRKTAVDLEPIIGDAQKLLKRMASLCISYKLNLRLSGSMTYVHNPHYRGSLAAYRRAMDAASLDTAKLDQLFRLEEVGILDLPMVYERWCLLRIIRTITEQFRFLPEPSYRNELFQRLATEWKGKSPLTIRFSNVNAKREIFLQYQPRIFKEGGKFRTPDFILTVKSIDRDVLFADDYYPKLVIDAKCKRFAPVIPIDDGARLSDELHELIVNRGYDQDGENRVFVVHPGWDSRSSEDWEKFCHYGGGFFVSDAETRPDWDTGHPDHRHGAVLLRPGINDHLVRLILMHFYLALEDTLGKRKNEPFFPPICPACGGVEMTSERIGYSRKTNRVNSTAIWCKECKQMIVRNYSGNCGTRLWKLGGYWTFHETDPLNPYNIKCPRCGDFMIIDKTAEYEKVTSDEIHHFY